MKVNTIGGGPGGLYASLLLKREHPDWDVTVYEQNPPDVTYGWGIVFPNRTLSNLAEADPPSHEAITETFERWDPFDIWYEGDRYRCGGNTFASMMRTDLLEVLQERCREVGVELQFETEITEPESLANESDLCIVADGIHSQTRGRFADDFGTEIEQGTARFSWFGTEKQFDALTHIFVENEDGIWCAHTYPGPTSTFIIDCDAETWEQSGIANMSEEEYLAYLEDTFSEYLDGHQLLSQQDRWRTFQTVTNEQWHHDNMVLLGDAAHTAHYSIGSGTTIALEDGIGLAEAFEDNDDIERALAAYEEARKPFVQNLMSAAERSRIHFEHIQRYYDLPARQFAVHHLTRSGRLTYGSLRERDPSLIHAFDEWFAGQTPDEDVLCDPARQPIRLADRVLSNRFVRAIEPTFSSEGGMPSDTQLSGFTAAAAEKPGLMLTEPLAVSPEGRPTAGSPGLYSDEHRETWAGAVDTTPTEVTVGAHLTHAGTSAAREPRVFGFGETAARESTWSPRLSEEYPVRPEQFHPDVLDAPGRNAVVEDFVDAARRADEAGFDYLQIQAGTNTLPGQYLLAERGSVSERADFLVSTVSAVADVWPTEKPLGVTIPVSDDDAEGLPLDDAFDGVSLLADAGCDIVAPVEAGAGVRGIGEKGPSDFSDAIRNETGVRTIATAPTTSVDRVNTLVASGRSDLCVFPRSPPPEE